MRLPFILLFCCAATSALAGDWAVRSDDRVLSHAEVQDLISGKILIFYDDGQSKYSAGGAYSYTYASGESAFGTYKIVQDGTICIAYRNGFERCDRYVESDRNIVLLTQDGLRFPVRPSGKK
ncbi:MAG: hypothetical protein AB8B62_02245 [Roseobacter sp.]